jgi:hypothetical protein
MLTVFQCVTGVLSPDMKRLWREPGHLGPATGKAKNAYSNTSTTVMFINHTTILHGPR